MLHLCLLGRFRIVGPAGEDLTPKGSKTQGLVALLALSPGRTCARVWLQDHLWSDRGRAQGAASLRQALAELRKTLGPHGAAMIADRRSVALDQNLISVDIDADGAAQNSQDELLQGIDISDEEFEDWLRHQRTLRAKSSASGTPKEPAIAAPRILWIAPQPGGSPSETMLAELFVDAVAKSLSEQFTLELRRGAPDFAGTPRRNDGLLLSASAIMHRDAAGVRATLEQGVLRRRLWAGHAISDDKVGPVPISSTEVERLVNEAVDGFSETLVADHRQRPQRLDAPVMGRLAVRKIFMMNAGEFDAADALLASASDLDRRGIYPAWRVLLRVIQLVERHPVDAATKMAEAVEFASLALELEPTNSMVLAAASNAAMLVSGNTGAAIELAQRSVRANPANSFAWDCLSTAALHQGALESAHGYAVRAQKLAGNTPFKHWYDMGRCLTATVTGRIDEAIQMATAASVMPSFRPPLRYLAALNLHAGLIQDALRARDRLLLLEPGFNLEQMLADRDYPVAALRKSGVLRPALFGPLG